jgi:HlyD family secretion protein
MLNESVVDRVRGGMPARVHFEGLRDAALEGHVETVESLPRRSVSDVPYYPCRITLEGTPSGLLPGMSAKVEVKVGRCRHVLAVPSEAVSVDQYHNICYVIGPSGLERREITPGGSTPEVIEVTDGLYEGEHVVLNPTQVLARSVLQADSEVPDPSETAAIAALR